VVDDQDFAVAKHKWYVIPSEAKPKAISTTINGKSYPMSRIILQDFISEVIDHEDRDPYNNQRYNLRPATRKQNAQNHGLSTQNTSGFKGVSWSKHHNRWWARIKVNQKFIHLGYYVDPIYAAKAYDRRAKEFFGEFAYLNFPEVT